MRLLLIVCFYFPLVTNLLNVQALISKFMSETLAQIFAYTNMLLLIAGIFFIIKSTKQFTPLIKIWITFYLSYYSVAILANIYLDTTPPLLKTLVPLVYFISFAFLLSIPHQIKRVSKILAFAFFTSCIFLILFNYFNFSMDHDGVYEYNLDRAGGLYGDANNACVAAILAFIFLKNVITPRNKFEYLLKLFALIIASYAIMITFSKTGFVVFFIVLCLTYRNLFSIKRLLLSMVFIPLTIFIAVNWALTTDKLTFAQKQRVESIVNIATLNTDKIGLSDRDVLFKNMMSFIQEHPFIGNGVNFSTIIRGHNTIFGVWADAGIFPFLLFLFLLFNFFRKSILSPSEIKFYTLSILITLTIFMLTLQSIINQGYLMVVFALLSFILFKEHQSLNSIKKK